ncbi:retropepsin-like aspartic protease family protein [Vannielia litorea]|uniref:retropepsin-like aspartic protease family protein n=1 Tax=Vannielia litorea TaxID=1217970 RepID=UPI001BD0198C|nr:TIGR02281 family clan AA aspartic protease [Vannielia litorea]MBS8227438.1 TIGR02281 family clan AA aspartic protease [Vannielia litorea]
MDGDTLGRLTYLILLGVFVGSYFFVSGRTNWGQTARHAALWVFIFLGAIVAYGLWNDVKREVSPRQSVFAEDGRVEVPVSPDGHYYLTLDINGSPTRFVVDTGASDMVLSRADARAAGIDPESLAYLGRANTANGEVRTALVRLDEVSLGDISDRNVSALVNDGEMNGSLLGMRYLERFASVSFSRGEMILRR